MMLSFDEWNVWFPENNLIDRSPTWPELSKRASDVYDMADVLCVGGMLLTLLENAARVRIACIAQLVNVLAPILTEPGGPAWRQTIWWPFALTSQYGRGQVLHTPVVAPVYDAKNRDAVPVIKSVTVLADTKDGPALHIFMINREPSGAPVDIEIDVRGCFPCGSMVHHCIRHDVLRTENTIDNPNAVMPTVDGHPVGSDGKIRIRLSGWSWNLVRIRLLR
jgi:alpha-N-arabinofuranosidase